jgi:hypothetical protein
MNTLDKALFDCKGKNKIHFVDIRLRNNAGMDFPTCKADASLLDLNACHYPMTGNIHETTCKSCLKKYHAKRRY